MAKKRVGAPKKPIKDRVSALTITVRNGAIEKIGGKEECRYIMKDALNTAYNKANAK